MQQIQISQLNPHPRNNEFFDDITGEKWTEFLKSVQTSGVIEPIVVTTDMTIVSGHQRVRACKELNINEVLCTIKSYPNEDAIIKDLLETNIRQRGDVGGSAKKVGLRIKELERLYGIQNGNNQYDRVTQNAKPSFTQEDLATKLGMSVDALQRYKALADMIPELDDMVRDGKVSKTTALAVMKQLSEDEQEDLLFKLDATQKYTQKQIQRYVDEIKNLKNNPPKPLDYDSTKQQLKDYKEDYRILKQDYDTTMTELQNLRKQLQAMKDTSPTEQYSQKLKDSTIFFCAKIADFIENVGGYVWLTDHINELPEYEKQSFTSAVNAINAWSNTMIHNITK